MRKCTSIVIALIASLLILVGCSADTETNTKNEDIQTMESVLRNNLTGPDEELVQIWNMIGEERIESLREYEEKLYKDYFANDTSYEEYISSNGSVLWIEPMRNDYILEVKNIDFEKTKSEEIIYDFTVEIEFHKEGSETSEVETVTGQANLNEDHKIEKMIIRKDELWSLLGK